MPKNINMLIAVCSGSVFTAACHLEHHTGLLVGTFSGEGTIFKTKILLPTADDKFQLTYELRHRDLVCVLTGRLQDADSNGDNCEGRSGSGKISCNDGRSLHLRWSLTSCQGGYGRSTEPNGAQFYFGFGHNKERALDNLARAK